MKSSALVVIAACGASPPPPPHAACPDATSGDVVRALSEPVSLDITVLDDFVWSACDKQPERVVRMRDGMIELDH